MDTKKPFACVMGDIDLLRPLGMAGISCVTLTKPGTMPRYSRYTKAVLAWHEPRKEPELVLETLLRFGHAQAEKPVLFYEDDAILKIVSKYRNELSSAFRFVIADETLVENLLDKYKFHGLAERVGLPVPETRLINAGVENDRDELDLKFPFIVKPVMRSSELWNPVAGSAKAVHIGSQEDFRKFKARFAALEDKCELIAQQLVAGPESAIESYQVYVDAAGEIAGEFTGRKVRTYPVELGHSCSLVIAELADLAALGREIVRKLNLRGVAELEFKRAPDGRLFLLEINPRFNLWHHLGAAAGVNLPALVYADLVGLPRPANVHAREGTRWCRVWQDLLAARGDGVPLGKWARWAMDCEVRRGLTWDDPLPILVSGIYRTASKCLNALSPRRFSNGRKLEPVSEA